MAISNGNGAGGGDGNRGDSGSAENSSKGKEKGKGKGKASEAAAAGSLPQDEGEGGAGVVPTGHAMLKSRLTSVSLRGLVQVDGKAVAVRETIYPPPSPSLRELACSPSALSAATSFTAGACCCHLRL